jgi:hypothetical protein
MRSKFVISPSGLPCSPEQSQRCWSVKKTMTFGCIERAMVAQYVIALKTG